MKKRGELGVGELASIILAMATLILGFFLVRGIDQKQREAVYAGTSSSLLQSYEIFVIGSLNDGEKLAVYPSNLFARQGDASFFVLGIKNTGEAGKFRVAINNENFLYNDGIFELNANEIKLLTIGIDTKKLEKGSRPYTISVSNPENIYASKEILVTVE